MRFRVVSSPASQKENKKKKQSQKKPKRERNKEEQEEDENKQQENQKKQKSQKKQENQQKQKHSKQEPEEEDEQKTHRKRKTEQIEAEPALRAEVRKGVQRVWAASVWLIARMPLVRARPSPSVRSQSARPRPQKVRWGGARVRDAAI